MENQTFRKEGRLEASGLQKTKQSLEDVRSHLLKTLKNKENEESKLSGEVRQTSKLNQQLAASLEEKQKELNDVEEAIAEAEMELSKAKSKEAALNKDISYQEEKMSDIAEVSRSLKEKHDLVNTDYEKIHQKAKELRAQVDFLRHSIKFYESRRAAAEEGEVLLAEETKKKIETCQSEYSSLHNQEKAKIKLYFAFTIHNLLSKLTIRRQGLAFHQICLFFPQNSLKVLKLERFTAVSEGLRRKVLNFFFRKWTKESQCGGKERALHKAISQGFLKWRVLSRHFNKMRDLFYIAQTKKAQHLLASRMLSVVCSARRRLLLQCVFPRIKETLSRRDQLKAKTRHILMYLELKSKKKRFSQWARKSQLHMIVKTRYKVRGAARRAKNKTELFNAWVDFVQKKKIRRTKSVTKAAGRFTELLHKIRKNKLMKKMTVFFERERVNGLRATAMKTIVTKYFENIRSRILEKAQTMKREEQRRIREETEVRKAMRIKTGAAIVKGVIERNNGERKEGAWRQMRRARIEKYYEKIAETLIVKPRIHKQKFAFFWSWRKALHQQKNSKLLQRQTEEEENSREQYETLKGLEEQIKSKGAILKETATRMMVGRFSRHFWILRTMCLSRLKQNAFTMNMAGLKMSNAMTKVYHLHLVELFSRMRILPLRSNLQEREKRRRESEIALLRRKKLFKFWSVFFSENRRKKRYTRLFRGAFSNIIHRMLHNAFSSIKVANCFKRIHEIQNSSKKLETEAAANNEHAVALQGEYSKLLQARYLATRSKLEVMNVLASKYKRNSRYFSLLKGLSSFKKNKSNAKTREYALLRLRKTLSVISWKKGFFCIHRSAHESLRTHLRTRYNQNRELKENSERTVEDELNRLGTEQLALSEKCQEMSKKAKSTEKHNQILQAALIKSIKWEKGRSLLERTFKVLKNRPDRPGPILRKFVWFLEKKAMFISFKKIRGEAILKGIRAAKTKACHLFIKNLTEATKRNGFVGLLASSLVVGRIHLENIDARLTSEIEKAIANRKHHLKAMLNGYRLKKRTELCSSLLKIWKRKSFGARKADDVREEKKQKKLFPMKRIYFGFLKKHAVWSKKIKASKAFLEKETKEKCMRTMFSRWKESSIKKLKLLNCLKRIFDQKTRIKKSWALCFIELSARRNHERRQFRKDAMVMTFRRVEKIMRKVSKEFGFGLILEKALHRKKRYEEGLRTLSEKVFQCKRRFFGHFVRVIETEKGYEDALNCSLRKSGARSEEIRCKEIEGFLKKEEHFTDEEVRELVKSIDEKLAGRVAGAVRKLLMLESNASGLSQGFQSLKLWKESRKRKRNALMLLGRLDKTPVLALAFNRLKKKEVNFILKKTAFRHYSTAKSYSALLSMRIQNGQSSIKALQSQCDQEFSRILKIRGKTMNRAVSQVFSKQKKVIFVLFKKAKMEQEREQEEAICSKTTEKIEELLARLQRAKTRSVELRKENKERVALCKEGMSLADQLRQFAREKEALEEELIHNRVSIEEIEKEGRDIKNMMVRLQSQSEAVINYIREKIYIPQRENIQA